MKHKTNFKCEDCGSKELLIPSWKTQDGMDTIDHPDPYDLDGDAWCIDCEKIIWVDTQ